MADSILLFLDNMASVAVKISPICSCMCCSFSFGWICQADSFEVIRHRKRGLASGSATNRGEKVDPIDVAPAQNLDVTFRRAVCRPSQAGYPLRLALPQWLVPRQSICRPPSQAGNRLP